MRLLVDTQLPPALARWLEDQGHEAEHVADLGLLDAPDREIWNYGCENRIAVVTKDEDFAVWRNTTSGRYPVVIRVRIGNSRKSDLLRWMEKAWPQVIAAL